MYSAVLCCFCVSQRSRKEREGISEKGWYLSLHKITTFCTQLRQSDVTPASLRQIVPSGRHHAHTNYSASARENSHMQPITENVISLSLGRLKIIRHGFLNAKKSEQKKKKKKTNSFKYLQHNACTYLWKYRSALKCGLMFHATAGSHPLSFLACTATDKG